MKFEIDFTEPKIQVSFRFHKTIPNAGLINVYFYSGERYQHSCELAYIGPDEILLDVIDGYKSNFDENDVGTIRITGETLEEKELFNCHVPWHSRNKETDSFLLLTIKESHNSDEKTFQHKRTF